MAIYVRCPECKKDHKPTIRPCKCCNAKLGAKFLVRIKDSQTGKWRTKTVLSLRQAKEVASQAKGSTD